MHVALLTFFAFPAERWIHLRTTNVVESPFATVRLRQRVTKGAGSRTKGLLMAYKLLDMAQQRWRRLNGAHLPPLVRAGVVFVDGPTEGTPPRIGRKPPDHADRDPQLLTISPAVALSPSSPRQTSGHYNGDRRSRTQRVGWCLAMHNAGVPAVLLMVQMSALLPD